MQSIIQKLKAEGVLKLYSDYRSGHLKDLSGNGNDGAVSGSAVLTNYPLGYCAEFNNGGRITHGDNAMLNTALGNTWSIFLLFQRPEAFDWMFGNFTGGSVGYGFGIRTASNLWFAIGATTTSDFVDITGATWEDNKPHTVIGTCNNTAMVAYFDGTNPQTAVNTKGSITCVAGTYTGGIPGGAAYDSKSGVYAAGVISRVLTATEATELHDELMTLKWSKQSVTKNTPSLDVPQNGLVNRWMLDNCTGITAPDSVGGKNGTQHNQVVQVNDGLGGCADFGIAGDTGGAKNCYEVATNLDSYSAFTVSAWVKRNTVAALGGWQEILCNGLQANTGVACSIRNTNKIAFQISSTGYNTTYSNTSVPFEKWVHIAWVYDGTNASIYLDGVIDCTPTAMTKVSSGGLNMTIGASRNVLGAWIDSGSQSKLKDVCVYNRALSATEIAGMYNKGRTALTKTETGVNVSLAVEGGVANALLSNSQFKFGDTAGRWKISANTINGKQIKQVECTTAGLLYIPTSILNQSTTESAFGSFEFWVNHADASVTEIVFIADTIGNKSATGQDGYYWYASATESVNMGESVNGTPTDAVTNAAGITAGIWTKFKITRTSAGVFTLYKNDIQLGSTFTDTTVTTSSYIVFDFDAGDQIALSDEFALTKRITI